MSNQGKFSAELEVSSDFNLRLGDFKPSGQVSRPFCKAPGALESLSGDVMRARFGPPLKLSQHDLAMIDMLDDAGFQTVQADEA